MNSDTPTLSTLVELLGATHFPELLGPPGLAYLQGAANVLKSALACDAVWKRCVAAGLPCLTQSALFLEGTQRHALMRCYMPLCRSIIAIGDQPLIRNVDEAKRLARLLHSMERAGDTHLRTGGSVASILVGRLQISPDWNAHVGEGNMSPQPNAFRLPQELNEYFGGCPELMVCLGSARDPMFLRLQFCHTLVQQRNTGQKRLTLDVRAACPEHVIDYRGAPVNLETHSCHATIGMHSLSHHSMACGTDPSPGILCACFIRDGQSKTQNANLALTLNLDKPRTLG